MSLAEIKKLLLKITPEERKQVRDTLNALDKVDGVPSTGTAVRQAVTDPDMLLHVFCGTLTGLGIPVQSAFLKKSDSYKSFTEKGQRIINTLRDCGVTDRVELEIVLELGIQLLYRNVQSWASAVTPRVLMTNFDRLLPCINAEFPDYLNNGLARWIAGARGKARHAPASVSPFAETEG